MQMHFNDIVATDHDLVPKSPTPADSDKNNIWLMNKIRYILAFASE